jgi:tetratricopeptide (TPR) repeat protein
VSGIDALLSDAAAEHKAGRLGEAEAAYRAAIARAPGRPAIQHNLGVVVAARGCHGEALALFDAALALEAGYASAHYNRGVALDALDRTREAIAAFSRAVALEPERYEAHRALGFLWLGQGERGRALDHFARTCELRRGDDRMDMAVRSLTRASRAKLVHDAEQFRYLAGRRREVKRFEMQARNYDRVAVTLPDGVPVLSAEQLEQLGEDYNTAIHVWSAPEVEGDAVNDRLDVTAITQHYKSSGGVAWFDGLLSPAALAGLRRFLLESTIWHDFDHIGGFVASYLEDGLACPLVLQIAAEMRTRFPELLSSHPLTQAWAFKGLESSAAVDAHADDAAVSLNFWMTPDASNLSPEQGGLRICPVPPPQEWKMSGYDADLGAIARFLGTHERTTVVVPYACNRAALFQSRLFHRSDAPLFAPGYDDRRINVTLLFGRHGD